MTGRYRRKWPLGTTAAVAQAAFAESCSMRGLVQVAGASVVGARSGPGCREQLRARGLVTEHGREESCSPRACNSVVSPNRPARLPTASPRAMSPAEHGRSARSPRATGRVAGRPRPPPPGARRSRPGRIPIGVGSRTDRPPDALPRTAAGGHEEGCYARVTVGSRTVRRRILAPDPGSNRP
jgi:hypothetical protein